MKEQLIKIITDASQHLVREIDPDHGLLIRLLAKGVLSSDQVDSCEAKETPSKRTAAVLKLLMKVEDVHFKTFCDILIDLKRKDLVDDYLQGGLSLLGETKSTSEHHPRTQTDSLDGDLGAHSLPTQHGPADVFISYRWSVHAAVEKLYKILTAEGVRCWKDDKEMLPGDVLSKEIEDAIEGCPVFLSCITKDYTESPYCMLEINYASTREKKIIPLRLDSVEWPPRGIGLITGSILYIDFCSTGQINWDYDNIKKLTAAIKKHLNRSV